MLLAPSLRSLHLGVCLASSAAIVRLATSASCFAPSVLASEISVGSDGAMSAVQPTPGSLSVSFSGHSLA